MTRDQILRVLPNASESFLRKNADSIGDSGKSTVAELCAGNVVEETPQTEEGRSDKFLVRITDVRKRLLDSDNLVGKYIIDCCRYAGILPDDAPGTTTIEVGQRKLRKGEFPHTEIEVFKCHSTASWT